MRGALVSCSKTRSALLVGSSGRSTVPSCGPQFGSWSLTRFRFCLWAMQCERGCRAAHLLRSAQSPSSPCPPPSLPSMHCTSLLSCSKIPPSLCRRQPGAARLRALAFAKIEAEQMVGARSWLRRQPRLFLQQLVAGMLLLAPFSKPLDRTGILLQGGERGICLQGGVGAAGLGMHSMRAAWHRGLRGGDAEVTPMCSAVQADPHPVLVQSVRWVFSAVVARGAAWIPSRDGLGWGAMVYNHNHFLLCCGTEGCDAAVGPRDWVGGWIRWCWRLSSNLVWLCDSAPRCVAVASGAVEFPGGALCPKWHCWGTARSQSGRGARMAPRPPLATLALGAKSHRLKQSAASEVGSRRRWPRSAPLHPCGQQPQDSMHGSGVQWAAPSEEPHLYRYEGQRSCPRSGMFSPHPFKLCVHSCDLWGFW